MVSDLSIGLPVMSIRFSICRIFPGRTPSKNEQVRHCEQEDQPQSNQVTTFFSTYLPVGWLISVYNPIIWHKV